MTEVERVLVAAKEGDLATLRSFRRLVPFATDGFGASTVHHAARNGKLDCIKWLLETIGEEATLKRSKTGATALHDAAAQGHLECVKYFIQKCSVPVDIRDASGHSPLHLAARFGRSEVVKWLLYEEDSNPNAKSRNHMTPVHFAAAGGAETCLNLLLSKAGYSAVNELAADGTTAIFLAAQDGNLKCLKYLHSIGGKCNTKTRDGILPIHGAAQNGHLDCLIYLTETGQATWADKDGSGATPAHYAASQGHVKVLQWLRTKGDLSSVDDLGGTPLHDAAEQGEFECIRYLVESAGLDVMQQDNFHATPVDLADKNAHRKCRDFLKIAAAKQAKQLRKRNESNKKPPDILNKECEDLNRHQTKTAFPGQDGPRSTPASATALTHKPQATSSRVRVSFEDDKTIQPPEQSVSKGMTVEKSSPRSSDSKRVEKTEPVVARIESRTKTSSSVGGGAISTASKSEQRKAAESLQTAEERGRNFSRSGLAEHSARLSRSLGDLLVASLPSNTTGGDISSARYARTQNPRPQSCSDIMMTRLKTGHFVPLPHAAVIPPPLEFSGDEANKDAGMLGVNPIVWQAMPQWKRQVYLNRHQKEEGMRQQQQQQEDEEHQKWAGIPLWRVPLIEKKEHEKLKEEQKWAEVPEWKKTILQKKQN